MAGQAGSATPGWKVDEVGFADVGSGFGCQGNEIRVELW